MPLPKPTMSADTSMPPPKPRATSKRKPRHRKPSEELPVLFLRMPQSLARNLHAAAAVMSKLAGRPMSMTAAAIALLSAGAHDMLTVDPSKARLVSSASKLADAHAKRTPTKASKAAVAPTEPVL